ncbi:MAG: hypothetical protein IPN17_20670 [Deltaproteobacteria bacterium]|nr:hypothetical protein [Deltaproteobacteria bacterium]
MSAINEGPEVTASRGPNRTPPSSAGRSAVAGLIERSAASTGARPLDGLRRFSQAELDEYGQILRAMAAERGEPISLRGTHQRSTESDAQRSALGHFASVAGGALEVSWDEDQRSPAALKNLLFVRRDLEPRAVWAAFLEEHYEALAQLWALGLRSDLNLTGLSPLDDETVVLSGELRRDGIPVDGEFVEAFVTTAASRLGPGVLKQVRVSAGSRGTELPAVPSDRWISADRAKQLADERRRDQAHADDGAAADGAARSATLRWSCGEECVPYWRVTYRSGWTVSVGAIDGQVLQARQEVARQGPLRIAGLPPGVDRRTPAAIRFRNANVVNSSGTSLGQTGPDGTHSFTQSTPVQIGFEGAVGPFNPARYGRIQHTQLVGTPSGPVYVDRPLRTSWTPSMQPAMNFSSPDAWGQNSGTPVTYPHSTEIMYGWLSYWQYLMSNRLLQEVPEVLTFAFNVFSGSDLACGQSNSGNLGSPSPDPNGSATEGTILCGVGYLDDVGHDAIHEYNTDGNAMFGAAHEYGHLVHNCAMQPGLGCDRVGPAALTVAARPPVSSWRPAVFDSASECTAQFVASLLSRYKYFSRLESENYASTWMYESYNSSSDDFGTMSQDSSSTADCSTVGCAPGFVCVQTDHGHDVSGLSGLCERACTQPTDCQRALYCLPTMLTNGSTASACVMDSYYNHFWDTVGTRLVFTSGWQNALMSSLYAASGQRLNATRDLVLGTDSYYSRFLNQASSRFETTRAVQSVYSGTGFVPGDDFPDPLDHAAAVPVRSTTWTPIWWGNGAAAYPRFEDYSDADVVMFRGVAGSAYRLETWFHGTAGSPIVEIISLDNLSTYWSSYSGSVTTTPLPTTGWYVAFVWGATGTTDWEGQIRVEPGHDDLSSAIAEALPMAHGVSAAAQAHTVGDADAFQILVPVDPTTLTLQVTGLSSATILLYDPTGNFYGSQAVSSSSPVWSVGTLPAKSY